MSDRPSAITEITRILLIDGGCFIIGGLIAFPLIFLTWSSTERIFPLLLAIVALGIGFLYSLLAFQFHSLKPWAYRLVHDLVQVDRLSLLVGLSKKVNAPEVRRAFNLDQIPNNENKSDK